MSKLRKLIDNPDLFFSDFFKLRHERRLKKRTHRFLKNKTRERPNIEKPASESTVSWSNRSLQSNLPSQKQPTSNEKKITGTKDAQNNEPLEQLIEVLCTAELLKSQRDANLPDFRSVFLAALDQAFENDLVTYSLSESNKFSQSFLVNSALHRLLEFLHAFARSAGTGISINSGQGPFFDIENVPINKIARLAKHWQRVIIFVDAGQDSLSHSIIIREKKANALVSKERNVAHYRSIDYENKFLDVTSKLASQSDAFPSFDMDFVYTWVNGHDDDWREMISKYDDPSSIDWDRYVQRDELKYSLRSVFMYARWFRNIYIVSNCKPPEWFRPNERIKWVYHEEIIPQEHLPTFNSHVIESCLYKIEGLSEHFVYMNDDVFLKREMSPRNFFLANGLSISRMETHGSLLRFIEEKEKNGTVLEWQQAALNGANLVFEEFGKFPLQLHQHSAHSLKVSVFQEIEKRFDKELALLRQQKFRSHKDLSPTSFLYHHFSFHQGKSVRNNEMVSIIVRSNKFKRQSKELETNHSLLYICLNDGGTSFSNEDFQNFKLNFLKSQFPIKAPWEK